jgi:hypothetical protein
MKIKIIVFALLLSALQAQTESLVVDGIGMPDKTQRKR